MTDYDIVNVFKSYKIGYMICESNGKYIWYERGSNKESYMNVNKKDIDVVLNSGFFKPIKNEYVTYYCIDI
jgi:hypothetical protein